MKNLTKAEMVQLAEIDPKAWDRVAASFGMTPEKLKEAIEQGVVWVVSDEVWNSLTGADRN